MESAHRYFRIGAPLILEWTHQSTGICIPSYDTKVFNQCDLSNSVMITIETWAELHPSLITIPCEWNYTVPYGIVYAEQPSDLILEFIKIIQNILAS